jgi:hypothetical protein
MNRHVISIGFAVALALVLTGPTARAEPNGKLKVFILAGQSNMQGKADVSTLPYMAMDKATKPLYDTLVDDEGNPRVFEPVQIAAFSMKKQTPKTKSGSLTAGFGGSLDSDRTIGIELAFGATMYEHLNEPILLIKTSWGGKSLNTNFRPPSAGSYVYRERTLEAKLNHPRNTQTREEIVEGRKKASGHYYRLMMEHVKSVLQDPGKYHPAYNPEAGYEIAGFVWFQGFNDKIDSGTYPESLGAERFKPYSEWMGMFIRDVRKELDAPQMNFVIGVIGIGGEGVDKDFRAAQAAPATWDEFKGNVVAVETAPFWDEKLDALWERNKAVRSSKTWKKTLKWMPEMAPYIEKAKPLVEQLDELNRNRKQMDRKDYNQQKAALDKHIDSVVFTPDELRLLQGGTGAGSFHYNGAAKHYCRFGEAFANALIRMEKTNGE